MTKTCYEGEITTYSQKIAGDSGNYDWEVRFDNTGPIKFSHEPGYIGITQFDEKGEFKERVLLSPNQVRELVAFTKKLRSSDWRGDGSKVVS